MDDQRQERERLTGLLRSTEERISKLRVVKSHRSKVGLSLGFSTIVRPPFFCRAEEMNCNSLPASGAV